MKTFHYLILTLVLCLWTMPALAVTRTINNVQDDSGNTYVTQGTTTAGEDVALDIQKVEQRFTFLNVTADVLVKTGAGMLHTVTCSSDAAATAGTIILYDNTAESGTIIWTWTISATEVQPRTLTFDAVFSNGLYVGYTTTADVTCTVTYR
jgi:hypothetical protein